MTLEMKHQTMFRNECGMLSQMIAGSLLKLASEPRDQEEIRKLVQSADTIMGNARFIDDKDLEKNATRIVKSFTGISDVRKCVEDYTMAIDQFGKLLINDGIVPKGYKFVAGTCVIDRNYFLDSEAD